MKTYRLILNEDITNCIDLKSTELEDCYEEALSVLGWSIAKKNDEQNEFEKKQLKFDFIA